jgi:Protein of unknown function (DUF3515)
VTGRRASLTGLAVLPLLLLLTACNGTPDVRVAAPTGDDTAQCPPLVPALPVTLDALEARQVEPSSPLVRAWGDPAVVLRCGVPDPPGYDPTATCVDINGVGWYAEPQERGVRFTSRWSTPRIEVTVPSTYAPEAGWLSTLSSELKGQLEHPGCPNAG